MTASPKFCRINSVIETFQGLKQKTFSLIQYLKFSFIFIYSSGCGDVKSNMYSQESQRFKGS